VPKYTLFNPFFIYFLIMAQFNSSVITSISEVVNNNEVVIEFHGRPYTYTISDVEAWQNDLNNVISEGESVGSFVNRAIRAGVLTQLVTA
jgi:hypothetical protein